MEKNYDPMKICGIVMMVYGVLYALLGNDGDHWHGAGIDARDTKPAR